VEVPNRDPLLVGGIPTAILEPHLNGINLAGPYRRIADKKLQPSAEIPRQTFGSWAGLPEDPLATWASQIIQTFERQPYQPSDVEAFEYYLPQQAKLSSPQFRRWFQDPPNSSSTILGRRRRLYGSREYRLLDLRAGRIVGACDLQDVDVRRLMYALDQKANNPVRAHVRSDGANFEIQLTSELPRAEQRMLASFAKLTIPPDRPFERRWLVGSGQQLARELLQSLGIAFESQGHPRT